MRIATRPRLGITAVEILVALAIVAVLIMLLLPAKQAAREAARRSQALNNLKQAALDVAGSPPAEGASTKEGPRRSAVPGMPRKIIYTAEIDLTVAGVPEAGQGLLRLVKECGGYVAQSDESGVAGGVRTGRWKVRIPADRLDAFEEGTIGLGELQRRHRDSQDVSEEFYDLEARIKTKKVEESRLLKHLEHSTGTLKDTLDVERELSRVRGEVEQQEGRLQLLANLTTLTTVTVTFLERTGYTPEASPTFATRAARIFAQSLENLVAAGEAAALAIVAAVPWLPVIVPAAAVAWFLLRRSRARARPAANP